jgi:lysophospholipase L1-like esterase
VRIPSALKSALLGTAAALLLCEAGLYLAGRAGGPRPRAEAGRKGSRSYLVYCFGNSYTAGVGAPQGQAYCDQLRGRLEVDPLFSGIEVTTRNFGKSYMNSSMVLDALARRIDEERPDLVLLMTGEPNIANRTGYGRYLEREGAAGHAALSARVGLALYELLSHSHTFRFLEILASGSIVHASHVDSVRSSYFSETPLKERETLTFRWLNLLALSPALPRELNDTQAREALGLMQELERRSDRPSIVPILVARLHGRHFGDHAKAAAEYERALAASTDRFNADAYFDLKPLASQSVYARAFKASQRHFPGDLVARKLDKITHWPVLQNKSWTQNELEKDLEQYKAVRAYFPDCELVLAHIAWDSFQLGRFEQAYSTIDWILARNPLGMGIFIRILAELGQKSPDWKPRADALLASFRTRFPTEAYRIGSIAEQDIRAWVRSDIVEMGKLLNRKNIPFILEAYPPKRDGALRIVDPVLPALADEMGYRFSDTLAYLNDYFKKTGKRESLYADHLGAFDDHLNAEGYGLVAGLLAEDIRRFGLTPGPAR